MAVCLDRVVHEPDDFGRAPGRLTDASGPSGCGSSTRSPISRSVVSHRIDAWAFSDLLPASTGGSKTQNGCECGRSVGLA